MTATPSYTPAPPPKKGPSGFVLGCLAAVVIAVLLLVGFIVAIFSLVMGATAAPVAAADAFFNAAATQGPAAAYALTAPSYQSAHPEPDFDAEAVRSKFTQVDHVSWNNRSVNNDTATLSGQAHYKGGVGEDQVIVTLQKSGEAWKVVGVESAVQAAPAAGN